MTMNGLFTTTSIHFDPTGTWLGITLLIVAFACLLFVLAPDKSRLSPRPTIYTDSITNKCIFSASLLPDEAKLGFDKTTPAA